MKYVISSIHFEGWFEYFISSSTEQAFVKASSRQQKDKTQEQVEEASVIGLVERSQSLFTD